MQMQQDKHILEFQLKIISQSPHKLGMKTKWYDNSGYIYGILRLLLRAKGIFFIFHWCTAALQCYANFCCTTKWTSYQFSSVAQSCPTLWPHESQHARPPCPLPTSGVHSDSRPLSQWCHLAISSSVVPFSSCPQSLPASESFPMSELFASGG